MENDDIYFKTVDGRIYEVCHEGERIGVMIRQGQDIDSNFTVNLFHPDGGYIELKSDISDFNDIPEFIINHDDFDSGLFLNKTNANIGL